MTEKFCLKWNDFDSNVSKSFSLFRNEDYLHDVTLVSDDQKQLSAQKLVLSSCSEYFRTIFKTNKNHHLLVCLDGINSQELNNILDYMYNGKVNIYQENLDRFLTIAQRLKLNGLLGDEKLDNSSGTSDQGVKAEHDPLSLTNSNSSSNYKEEHNQTVERPIIRKQEYDAVVALNQDVGFHELNDKVNESIEQCPDGSLKCRLCGKTSSSKSNIHIAVQKQNMRSHIETHLGGLSFTCPFCQKNFRSRNSLNSHKSVRHRSN